MINFASGNRRGGMAFASLSNKASASLGVRVTEGEGNLPKLVLSSPAGRCVVFYNRFSLLARRFHKL